MIQVCSQCGTRWNVRDRQRVWCPRCNGSLLPPSAPAPGAQWAARPTGPAAQPGAQRPPHRLPPGYRWIAVRPGAAPPTRRGGRPPSPTPHYTSIPRWGLVEYFAPPEEQQAPPRGGPSLTMVRTTLVTTLVVLGVAALVHVLRYGLLLINRTVLLHPLIAGAATWLGVLVSVIAMFLVVASIIVLTNWLIARRAAAYARSGQSDPRRLWVLRAGCLVPIVNLVLAPVFLIELATVEDRNNQLRKPIVVWWILWVVSTAVSVLSIATSFTSDPQRIADNTVTTTVAYLVALAALLLAMQVFLGFERTPVSHPVKRWVIAGGSDEPASPSAPSPPDTAQESAVPVESKGQNPAA